MKPGKIHPRINFWANILLFAGLIELVLFSYLIFQRYNPQKLAFNINEVSANDSIISNLKPIGLKIDSINLSLVITESEIKNNQWQASTNSVSHLKTSPVPGEKGNSILYGHNWPNLLGDLSKVKPGDIITIIYNDNSASFFEVEYLTKVGPEDSSILKASEDNRITLYTCTGFLDSQRLVVVAKLING
jgi:LPXTG-site transpeptidase (sortase) family protein